MRVAVVGKIVSADSAGYQPGDKVALDFAKARGWLTDGTATEAELDLNTGALVPIVPDQAAPAAPAAPPAQPAIGGPAPAVVPSPPAGDPPAASVPKEVKP